MVKTALIFPGQGSQFVGMTKDIVDHYQDELVDLTSTVREVMGDSFLDLLWNGPMDELSITTNTQPALFTASAMVTDLLKTKGLNVEYLAGHSLGEYSALYYADVYDFETGLNLVKQRSQLMEKAMPAGTGAMAAIIGGDMQMIEEICKVTEGVVEIANYNNESQIIISGEKQAVEMAMNVLKEKGAKHVISLNVSGPFHSSLMRPAAEDFSRIIQNTTIGNAAIPIIANVTAQIQQDSQEIKRNLIAQLYQPVKWLQTIKYLLDHGVTVFVECGAGKVLSGIIKRIDRGVTCYAIQNTDDIESLMKNLNT